MNLLKNDLMMENFLMYNLIDIFPLYIILSLELLFIIITKLIIYQYLIFDIF
jgi:hypothetical protein